MLGSFTYFVIYAVVEEEGEVRVGGVVLYSIVA